MKVTLYAFRDKTFVSEIPNVAIPPEIVVFRDRAFKRVARAFMPPRYEEVPTKRVKEIEAP